jgi:hypothetical protein
MLNYFNKFKVYILGVFLTVTIAACAFYYFQNKYLESRNLILEQKITSIRSLLLLCKENSKVEQLEVKFENREPKEERYEPIFDKNDSDNSYTIQFFSM